MNELIKIVYEAGWSTAVYWIFHGFAFLSAIILLAWFAPKLNIGRWKAAVIVMIFFPMAYGWMFIMCWAESGFQAFGGNNVVRIFPYIPLFGLAISALYKIKWRDVFHLILYAPLIGQGIGHFGCVFSGCCSGYVSDWGVYHPVAKAILFPIQPIEATTALIIIGILLKRAKKRNYVSDGLEYPIMLILFGSTRFIFEFFRANRKIWLGCSSLSFHALFMFAVGIIAYFVIRKMNRKDGVS